MKKIFSPINIMIMAGIIILAYLGYGKYIENKNSFPPEAEVIENSGGSSLSKDEWPDLNSGKEQDSVQISEKDEADEDINEDKKNWPSDYKPEENDAETRQTDKEMQNTENQILTNGIFENEVYGYRIECPEAWPLKYRSAENVSIGTAPPKDGQGAVTIEVSSEDGNEVEEAEAEAKKYPGMVSIEEEDIILAGIKGDKITLNNLMSGSVNIYIILERNGLYYAIKYAEESPEFAREAERSVLSFEFYK